jgi:Spy/CpxP family protein refolding chaperone
MIVAPDNKESVMHRTLLITSIVATLGWLAVAAGQTTSPYAGQQHRAIKALSDDEVRDLLDARGMGLAKAGELNSYPGPLHVLQLGNALGLSDMQRAETERLYSQMRDKAKTIGRTIIEAERKLDQAFATGQIDPASLAIQVNAIATLQGELRTVHLATHLAQRSLLTPEQIARYDEFRGYAGDRTPHGNPQHRGD